MKKIRFMDTSFRDGFQSCLGARIRTEDFIPALQAAVAAGTDNFEIGGGACFQSPYFYCQQDAFETMDKCRQAVGPDINLQTLSRGANVVGLISQSRDIIDLHARLFKKHGISTIRNFDALNDVRNLAYSGSRINAAGLKHQITISMMGLPPGLDGQYAHSPQFYLDSMKAALKAEIPFDSIAFKDASGTATPYTVYETIKSARKLLPANILIEFHTHDTAGMAVSCNMAAIEAGADIIDLAMSPLSGGTCQADILTMWHRLKGTDYTLDIDHEKILEAEAVFEKCLSKYFIPPESREVSPLITFSPMPGGALTANTQMMRDNNCLELYPQVIREMREVVAKGGFGTSVTPVSQFYFQQAFANVTQGKWKKITDGYGKMVLGYFGRTPAEPDQEIVRLASEQLELNPTAEDVHDINDRNPKLGIKAATEKLQAASLPVTDENIFITATCEDKGIEFLKGNCALGIRYKVVEEKKSEPAKVEPVKSGPACYVVNVEGRIFNVQVAEGGTVFTAPGAEKSPAAGTDKVSFPVVSPMPGSVTKIMVNTGMAVEAGDTVIMLEAMKMESAIKTHKSGIVFSIPVTAGQTVATGDTLVVIEEC